jgi:hypothetical protein
MKKLVLFISIYVVSCGLNFCDTPPVKSSSKALQLLEFLLKPINPSQIKTKEQVMEDKQKLKQTLTSATLNGLKQISSPEKYLEDFRTKVPLLLNTPGFTYETLFSQIHPVFSKLPISTLAQIYHLVGTKLPESHIFKFRISRHFNPEQKEQYVIDILKTLNNTQSDNHDFSMALAEYRFEQANYTEAKLNFEKCQRPEHIPNYFLSMFFIQMKNWQLEGLKPLLQSYMKLAPNNHIEGLWLTLALLEQDEASFKKWQSELNKFYNEQHAPLPFYEQSFWISMKEELFYKSILFGITNLVSKQITEPERFISFFAEIFVTRGPQEIIFALNTLNSNNQLQAQILSHLKSEKFVRLPFSQVQTICSSSIDLKNLPTYCETQSQETPRKNNEKEDETLLLNLSSELVKAQNEMERIRSKLQEQTMEARMEVLEKAGIPTSFNWLAKIEEESSTPVSTPDETPNEVKEETIETLNEIQKKSVETQDKAQDEPAETQAKVKVQPFEPQNSVLNEPAETQDKVLEELELNEKPAEIQEKIHEEPFEPQNKVQDKPAETLVNGQEESKINPDNIQEKTAKPSPNPEETVALAMQSYITGDYDQAIKVFDTIKPTSTNLNYLMAILKSNNTDKSKVQFAVDTILAEYFDTVNVDELLMLLDTKHKWLYNTRLTLARQLQDESAPLESFLVIEELQNENHSSASFLEARGELHFSNMEIDKAVQDFSQLEHKNLISSYHTCLFFKDLRNKKYSILEHHLSNLKKTQPFYSLNIFRAILYAEKGNQNQACLIIKKMIDNNQLNPMELELAKLYWSSLDEDFLLAQALAVAQALKGQDITSLYLELHEVFVKRTQKFKLLLAKSIGTDIPMIYTAKTLLLLQLGDLKDNPEAAPLLKDYYEKNLESNDFKCGKSHWLFAIGKRQEAIQLRENNPYCE